MPDEKQSFRTPQMGELWEKLKPLAHQKRHEPTKAEDRLWQQVRRNQLGAHIRRQHAIERFIVDFYCAAARLVIEVDGPIHDYTPEEDAIRQEYLESLGLHVIRFTNDQVFNELGGVLDAIRDMLTSPSPQSHPHSDGAGLKLPFTSCGACIFDNLRYRKLIGVNNYEQTETIASRTRRDRRLSRTAARRHPVRAGRPARAHP